MFILKIAYFYRNFSNSGPPRYQVTPGAPPLRPEYERPPPYYFPGSG